MADGMDVRRVEFLSEGALVEYSLLPDDIRGAMSRTRILRVPYEQVSEAVLNELYTAIARCAHALLAEFDEAPPIDLDVLLADDEGDLRGPYDNPNERSAVAGEGGP